MTDINIVLPYPPDLNATSAPTESDKLMWREKCKLAIYRKEQVNHYVIRAYAIICKQCLPQLHTKIDGHPNYKSKAKSTQNDTELLKRM